MRQLPKRIRRVSSCGSLLTCWRGRKIFLFITNQPIQTTCIPGHAVNCSDRSYQEHCFTKTSWKHNCLPSCHFQAAACYLAGKTTSENSHAKKMAVGEALRRLTHFLGCCHSSQGCDLPRRQRGSRPRNNGRRRPCPPSARAECLGGPRWHTRVRQAGFW